MLKLFKVLITDQASEVNPLAKILCPDISLNQRELIDMILIRFFARLVFQYVGQTHKK